MEKELKNVKAVMTTGEAADYLGMSKSALEKSRSNNSLLFGAIAPKHFYYGRKALYKTSTLDAWLANLPEYSTLAEKESA